MNYQMNHILYQIFKIILSILLKKNETVTDNHPIRIYVNKIENTITFLNKARYYPKVLTPKTIKLLGNTKNELTKDKIEENVPYLEITEVVLVHSNIVNNNYQHDSRVWHTFVPNKSFGLLVDILSKKLTFLKCFNSEILYSKIWFPNQSSKPLDTEDNINKTLIINYRVICKQ